ncbi:MAG: methyltransferase domain-containing protein [Myxococcaceae bacterium]
MASPIAACRICGSASLADVLSLGDMPPVNSFLKGPAQIAAEKKHPLAIAFCSRCSHVQLTHMLDPKDIFTDYIYFSSMSETVVRWGEQLANRYKTELSLAQKDLVAELASNDGCILKPFKAFARIQGVEPAKNVAEVAIKDGVPTHADFFNGKLARELRRTVGPAKLIIARNVVAHVPEVVDFIEGAGHWLADDGVLHVEVPWLEPMVKGLEFDTIYHEHLSYFSVTALDELFRRAGLTLWDVEEIPLHGGSVIARGKRNAQPKPSVGRYLAQEKASGLTAMPRLQKFAEGTRTVKAELPGFLRGLRKDGKRLAAYGAAAKGVVLTNYCGIGKDLLDFVADRSPYKQNHLMPGTHIEVVAPSRVMEAKPEHLLVLAWNFFDEIAKQLDGYHKAGGRFVLPIPTPQIR